MLQATEGRLLHASSNGWAAGVWQNISVGLVGHMTAAAFALWRESCAVHDRDQRAFQALSVKQAHAWGSTASCTRDPTLLDTLHAALSANAWSIRTVNEGTC